MLSCVPFTEARRFYRTKYWTYIVTGSRRCVLLFISQLYFIAFGMYGSHNHICFNHEVFMLSMSSLACFDLVTGFFFCDLTLANVFRKFKLGRLSSLVY